MLVKRPLPPSITHGQQGPSVGCALAAIVVYLLLTTLGLAPGAPVLDAVNTVEKIGTWGAIRDAITAEMALAQADRLETFEAVRDDALGSCVIPLIALLACAIGG